MPRRSRPSVTSRSEHWLRVAVNLYPGILNRSISDAFGWQDEAIEWKSPVQSDEYAEYYDQAFLDRLAVDDLVLPLRKFWPSGGPRWDGLARTASGKLILVEAKAYVEECVDYKSRASSDAARTIRKRLNQAQKAFGAAQDARWHSPLYQMANRLAHLHYLAGINEKDAYLIFLHFANAPDVPEPTSVEAWEGAIRLSRKCLGLTDSKLLRRVADIVLDVRELQHSQLEATG